MKRIKVGGTVVEFGDGWSDEELILFEKFYQDNPDKLKSLNNSTSDNIQNYEFPLEKKSKQKKLLLITQVESLSISYKNIHDSIKDGTLKEGKHFKKDKKSGKLWFKQEAVDKLLKLFVITKEEYDEFEKLYNLLRWDMGLSENKIAIALSEQSKDFTYTAAKNFIYGYNPNRNTYRKKVFLKYLSALRKAVKEYK